MTAAAVDPESFRRACAKFATGITVATVSDESGIPFGMTANSFTSVSLQPPLILFCIDYRCTLLPAFRRSQSFGINILREEQQDLSVRFASACGDRFEGVEWYRGKDGVPLLKHALANLACSSRQVIEAGDHTVLVAEVQWAEWREGRPLLYFDSRYQHLWAGNTL